MTADDELITSRPWTDPEVDLDAHSLFGISLNDFEVMPIASPRVKAHCSLLTSKRSWRR